MFVWPGSAMHQNFLKLDFVYVEADRDPICVFATLPQKPFVGQIGQCGDLDVFFVFYF
jgi:hypothetical protein